jgi:pimeloyl-ACP methyl ester carboxylesterase
LPLLGRNFRAIALDSVGGWGYTDVNAPVPYGVESRQLHLADVMNALNIEKAYIVGNSQGAWVAARYATLHSDRVKKMTLVASATIAMAMGVQMPETEGMRILRSFDGTPASMRKTMEAIVYKKDMITDELVNTRLASANRPGAEDARRRFRDGDRFLQTDPAFSINFDMKQTLPRLTSVLPTIFIWGQNDEFASPEGGKQLEKLLPNVPFHWVPDSGHQVQTDQPETFAKIVTDFFRK